MASEASDVEIDPPSIATVHDEVVQSRKESAVQHERMMRELAKKNSPESGTPRHVPAGQRAANNAAAKSTKFHVLVGPGAEEGEAFQENWVLLMSAEGHHAHFRNAFGRQIVRTINFMGRDLKDDDKDVLNVALSIASAFGP